MATVLYVDDEDAIRRVVVSWLTRRGHTVHTAATLADARALLESRRIDGAFVDVRLGDENGVELQTWIEEHQPRLSSNIVYVTGDVGSGEVTSPALANVDRPVLAKPFELLELDAIVERWVGKSSTDDS